MNNLRINCIEGHDYKSFDGDDKKDRVANHNQVCKECDKIAREPTWNTDNKHTYTVVQPVYILGGGELLLWTRLFGKGQKVNFVSFSRTDGYKKQKG